MPRPTLCPVLVGRDQELVRLQEAWLDARRGEGRLVAVAAEAGMGKTRLVRELTSRAPGWEVMWGACSETGLAVPYLPFVEGIGNWLAHQDLDAIGRRIGEAKLDLGQLFPQLGPVSHDIPSDPGQAKLRLFESFISLLSIPAEDQGLVLVLDDVHWADSSTRELIDHLVRRISTLPVLTVFTYRRDEVDRRHPLRPLLQTWRKAGLLDTIELRPLSPDGVAHMLEVILEATTLPPELVAFVSGRSEGNPFIVEEMVRDALDQGHIHWTPKGWSITTEDLRIPETVKDAILLRIGRLQPSLAEVINAAAVLGRSFHYRTLVAVTTASEMVVQEALAEAVAGQLLEELPGGGYRWRHALTREAINSELVLPKRQAIHSRAADALAAESGSRPVEVAHHLLEGGRHAEAVAACVAAAEEAERARSYSEAADLYQRALPHVDFGRPRADLLCRAGSALWMDGRTVEAQELLTEGIAALVAVGDDLEAAHYRLILGRCHWERERPDLARGEFESALRVLEPAGASADLALAHLRLAGLHLFQMDYAAGLAEADKAVATAEEAGAELERIWALVFRAVGLLDVGDVAAAMELSRRCWEEASEKGHTVIAGNVAYNEIWARAHLMLGDLDQVLARFSSLPQGPFFQATEAICRGYAHRAQGRLEEGLVAAGEASTLWERLGNSKMLWRCRVLESDLLLQMGQVDQAGLTLPSLETHTELQDLIYDAVPQIRYRLATGDAEGAARVADMIVEAAEPLAPYLETLAMAVEGLVPGGRLADARRLLEVGMAHPTSAGRGWLAAGETLALLAEGNAAGAAEAAGAAVAAAREAGYRPAEARARLLLSRSLHQLGHRAEAEAELRMVISEATEMGAGLLLREAVALAREWTLEVEAPISSEPVADSEPEMIPVGERMATVLFADVRGYTSMAVAEPPAELAEHLANLHRWASVAVERQQGVIDKFAGDAVMATFNLGGATVDHARQALRAALTLRDGALLGGTPVGIGIATGPVVAGQTVQGANITVTGTTTNLAARLQADAGPGEILLAEETHRRVAEWLPEAGLQANQETIALKGFDTPQEVYRIPPSD